jgi:hypothetical protein
VKDEQATNPNFDNIIDATGFQYLVGKYDAANAGSLVWYLGGTVGLVELQATLNGLGLSHIVLLNPGDVNVPDGGSVLVLLGGALACLGFLRRKLS